MISPRGKRVVSRWQNEPDVQLMLRVQSDDPGAFSELIRSYWPRVFGQFVRQFGDRQEAEDLAQDVFLRVYRNRRRYIPKASFSTWLFHIARNVARNAIRTRRRRPAVSLSQVSVGQFDTGAEERLLVNRDEPPTVPMEREEAARMVRQAMGRLAERQRAALELQFRDRSYSEIADELDMTPKAAKSLLYRARLQLRDSLHPYMTSETT
jgi:RNA polymerase sigma-70 factor (ECF subfamily)